MFLALIAHKVIHPWPIDNDATICGQVITLLLVRQRAVVLPDFDGRRFRVEQPLDQIVMRAEDCVDLDGIVWNVNDAFAVSFKSEMFFARAPCAFYIEASRSTPVGQAIQDRRVDGITLRIAEHAAL